MGYASLVKLGGNGIHILWYVGLIFTKPNEQHPIRKHG